ncbi:MAG: FHIPEP family type III secretion protein [Elusimicrobiales bacterium]
MDIKKIFKGFSVSEAFIAFSIISVVFLLIIPVPLWVLDFLFMALILFSMTVFFISFMITESMEFSAFPSVLLISSLARLVLTVAATKKILIEGSSGKLVESLGGLFLGGNTVIGLVVFAIIITVQYIVITGGTIRISEVSARFTLDAMPGKQMSIDADLNSGIITEEEARKRRRVVEDEADFYGSMDGASKFVRGDAIASIIIILISLIGGMTVALINGSESVYQAFQKYSKITVGVGLLAQISSLLTSVSAGILVSRATSGSDLASEIFSQIFIKKEILYIISFVSMVVFFIPSSPKIVLLSISVISFYFAFKSKEKPKETKEEKEAVDKRDLNKEETEEEDEEEISLELGIGLLGLLGENGNGLYEKIEISRKNLSKEFGFNIPAVRLKNNSLISPNNYSIKIFGWEAGKGNIQPLSLLAINSGLAKKIAGRDENVSDPVFNMPSLWIRKEEKNLFEKNGYTVVSAQSIIITHLGEVLKRYSHELLTRQTVSKMIENLKKKSPSVVDEVIPNLLTVGDIHRALQHLLKENIPIKNFSRIMEAFSDQAKVSKDPVSLGEAARKTLGRVIIEKNSNSEGVLEVYTLSQNLEQKLLTNVKKNEGGFFITLPPSEIARVADSIADYVKKRLPEPAVIACSSAIRYPLKKITEKVLSGVNYISYEEITPDAKVKILGQIDG